MDYLKQSVGIDISKKDFHVCFSVIGLDQRVKVKGSRKFENSPKGFKAFQVWYGKKSDGKTPLVFLMEATGIYHELLAHFLHDQGEYVSVIVPTKAKRYLQSLGNKSKNDKIDAQGLAQMGAQQLLPIWTPPTPSMARLKALVRELEALHGDRTMVRNRLEALRLSAVDLKDIMVRLDDQVDHLEGHIELVRKAIENTIGEDAELQEKVTYLTSIKGVGIITAATVIAETHGFVLIENQAQLVSYAGYDVIENQSGSRSGRTRISKKGNSHIRRALHMASLGVVRHSIPVFKALYERLVARGRRKMQAYVAVQKKLLVLLWTLWRKSQLFDPKYAMQQQETGSISV